MTPTKKNTHGPVLAQRLRDEGRSVTWLCSKTGYSRSYVTRVLEGDRPWTDEFGLAVSAALDFTTAHSLSYRGQQVVLPTKVSRVLHELPVHAFDAVMTAAWKDAWIRENGAQAVEEAADRAWQAALAIGEALRG